MMYSKYFTDEAVVIFYNDNFDDLDKKWYNESYLNNGTDFKNCKRIYESEKLFWDFVEKQYMERK